MTNKSLPERLEELIGEPEATSKAMAGYYEASARDDLRCLQEAALPNFAASIEADLKGLLPKLYTEPDSDPLIHASKAGYNLAVNEMSAAIERWCRGHKCVNAGRQECDHER